MRVALRKRVAGRLFHGLGRTVEFDHALLLQPINEHSLVGVLRQVVRTESTPPLWYVAGWFVHRSGVSVYDVRLLSVAANAVLHGGGVRDVRIGRASGRFACEIVDPGPGFDQPAAGYLAPRPGSGSGLWIARQLTWQIDFFRAAEGFTARIVL